MGAYKGRTGLEVADRERTTAAESGKVIVKDAIADIALQQGAHTP